MHDPLAPLLVDGVIDEVVARLKSGKEADLWVVRHRGEAIAAKVYKARLTRSFRNDAVYREGRQVRDTRTQRAMARGSRFGQAVRMLGCDLIHGDLSPYNVLVGAHGPVVIDFPQVVGAAHNSQAESFFQRDLENLRRFFAAHDPALGAAAGDAREIWRAYVRRELTADFVPTGREPPAPQRSGGGHAPGE